MLDDLEASDHIEALALEFGWKVAADVAFQKQDTGIRLPRQRNTASRQIDSDDLPGCPCSNCREEAVAATEVKDARVRLHVPQQGSERGREVFVGRVTSRRGVWILNVGYHSRGERVAAPKLLAASGERQKSSGRRCR